MIIGGKPGCNPAESSLKATDSKLHTISEFIIHSEIDNYNLYKLLEFCKQSKITHKLHGFAEKYTPVVSAARKPAPQSGIRAFLKEISNKNNTKNSSQQVEEKGEIIQAQPLVHILALLECLTSHNSDGRIVCTRQPTVGKATIKYLLLNPAPMFAEIMEKARSVILAGGTMQPVSEFTQQLFQVPETSRFTMFSCGHVIPRENILPLVLCQGPSGTTFDFSFQSRSSQAVLNEFGRLLGNICNIIPGGVVCFFPSYEYENEVYQHLDKNGTMEKISLKKRVFREPKKSSQVDSVLLDYAKTINQAKKNLLMNYIFSLGGKLSEGLNFSDELGRCVMVVGMPYPNIKSPELQEKMSYLERHVGVGAGRIHYENLCMKAVNQSIGRAVRHIGDYAAMLLVDHRYAKENICKQLPTWIAESLQIQERFGPAIGQIVKVGIKFQYFTILSLF
ncbi:hypothetical protein AAG570_008920 [Ranatra chinensis]|uniref:DNA 5'-3' helicase n=1 Tax=Ranatra chinensis TaxID=642074 RepID=A0ABD0YS96_9HEMI